MSVAISTPPTIETSSGIGGPAVKYCTAHMSSTGTLIASRTHALMRRAFARLTCAFSDMADALDGGAATSGVPVNSASGTPKKPESAKRFAVLGSDEPSSHFVTACRETSSACASASCDSPRSFRSVRIRAPSSLSIESLLCVDGAIVAVFGAKVHQVFRYYR